MVHPHRPPPAPRFRRFFFGAGAAPCAGRLGLFFRSHLKAPHCLLLQVGRIVKDANSMILWNYCQHPEFFTNWVASKFTDCFDNITRYWKGTINRVSAPQARFPPKYCLLIVDLRLGNLSFPTSQSVSNCKNQLKISKNPKFIIWYKIWFDTKISALEQIVRLQREPTDQLHMT